MSESDIKQARDRTREAADRFDSALDTLAGRIESGADVVRGIGQELSQAAGALGEDLKHKILEPIGGYLDEAGPRAERAFSDIRVSAENELKRMDTRPLAAWMTVFLGGLFLGVLAAQATQSTRSRPHEPEEPLPLH